MFFCLLGRLNDQAVKNMSVISMIWEIIPPSRTGIPLYGSYFIEPGFHLIITCFHSQLRFEQLSFDLFVALLVFGLDSTCC